MVNAASPSIVWRSHRFQITGTGLRRFRTGIDWSGDAGFPVRPQQSPYLVIAAVHLLEDHVPRLNSTLAEFRRDRRLPVDAVMKYAGLPDKLRVEFFQAISQLDLAVTVHAIDKSDWATHVDRSRPHDRLDLAIAKLVAACDPIYLDGQIILIDRPKAETRANQQTARVIHAVLATAANNLKRKPRIRPCPDHRIDGTVIQVADMVAGAVRADPSGSGRILIPVRGRIRWIE